MPAFIYPAVHHDTFLDFASNFARFLVNNHPTHTGPGWTIVEAYDASENSRQVPGDPSNLGSFAGTFSWKDDTVGVDDWIVLRSARGGTDFQVYFKVTSTTEMTSLLVPLDNWATDVGTPTANPVVPDESVGNGASPVSLAGFSNKQLYSIVADVGMVSMLFDNLKNPNWIYVGELLGGPPSDTRPFVILSQTANVYYTASVSASGNWHRISPLDNETRLTSGVESIWYINTFPNHLHRNNFFGLPGSVRPLPIGVFFPNAGHRHYAGMLNHVFSASTDLGRLGTMGPHRYMFRHDGNFSNQGPAICFEWDGTTPYPPPPT